MKIISAQGRYIGQALVGCLPKFLSRLHQAGIQFGFVGKDLVIDPDKVRIVEGFACLLGRDSGLTYGRSNLK